MNFKKEDRYAQHIRPGDICVYDGELIIYKRESWGGEGSRGEYGQFITSRGVRSLKYSSVVFAFDPMGERRNASPEITNLVKKYYEG